LRNGTVLCDYVTAYSCNRSIYLCACHNVLNLSILHLYICLFGRLLSNLRTRYFENENWFYAKWHKWSVW